MERYQINIDDESLAISGELTIQEIIDLIDFYGQQGYTTISAGYENPLVLLKKYSEERIDEIAEWESDFEIERLKNEDLERKVQDLEKKLKLYESVIRKFEENSKVKTVLFRTDCNGVV